MKILILGAGQVGTSVASNLVSEDNDITVIDQSPELLRNLQEQLDLKTVHGNAAYPAVLQQAGAENADMVIAVTNSDEVNMIACQVAYTRFHTPTKIARVRAPEYLSEASLFAQDALPIDVLINPEQLVTDHIRRLIENPGALQVLDFADDRVRLVGLKAYYGGPLVGHELRTIKEHIPGLETRVAAIYRRDRPIYPEGTTVIEADDEVFFVAAKENIRKVISELRRQENPFKRILIAGGGNIGKRLAERLQHDYHVKIIEHGANRARTISEELERTIVLRGDAADENLLREENIQNTDVFCAVTNDDEANILSSLLAKRLGARKVMTLINRPAYVDLMQSAEIDIAISPQQVTIGSLLTHIRRGDVAVVHSLRRGAAEAIEAIAHGDRKTSKVIGRTIAEINLPKGSTIGAIVRDGIVHIAHSDTVIMENDHIILFLIDKRHIKDVERLFQLGATSLGR